jgi:hypothetical protein
MLTVALAGILVAIGGPQYQRMVDKVKHANAKSMLSHLYTTEVMYKAEYGLYIGRLDALGFDPAGSMYFDIGFNNSIVPPPDAAQGTGTCLNLCPINPGCLLRRQWVCMSTALYTLDGNINATATASTFLADAHAHFGLTNSASDGDFQTWSIDQDKTLRYVVPAN